MWNIMKYVVLLKQDNILMISKMIALKQKQKELEWMIAIVFKRLFLDRAKTRGRLPFQKTDAFTI